MRLTSEVELYTNNTYFSLSVLFFMIGQSMSVSKIFALMLCPDTDCHNDRLTWCEDAASTWLHRFLFHP